MTTNISIVNDATEELRLSTTVSPSLSSDDWGVSGNAAPANSRASNVAWFNRDDGIHDGDSWVFTTTFTYDGVAVELEEKITGTLVSSDMWQRMHAGGADTGWSDTSDSRSITFAGASGAEYELSWELSMNSSLYDDIEYTLKQTAPVKPTYAQTTPVMPQIKTVVYLMLENRSLDNVLGWLYDGSVPAVVSPPGSPTTYDGIPSSAENKYHDTSYKPSVGTSGFSQPSRVPAFDPNEPMAHVQYQLYANAEGTLPTGDFWSNDPPMTGFAWDYYSIYDDPSEVMGAYSRTDLPVLNGLAAKFGVSDRWFASVPTQTDPNRAFSVCGTSLGAEANTDIDESTFANALTIFNALGANGKSWGMYYQSTDPLGTGEPITSHAPFTSYYFSQVEQASNGAVATYETFLTDAKAGTLPDFCFLEPYWGGGKGNVGGNTFVGIQGNDYHPPSWIGPAEYALNELYNTLVNSPQWDNMLFVISFDEHGGTYDHVAPTCAPAPDGRIGGTGFQFERLGVRVPTILVSPYVAEGTVFRSPDAGVDFDHTSFIATMLKWAGVEPSSAGLGARVATAPTFDSALSGTARSDKPTFTVPSDYKDQGGGSGSGPGIISAPATIDIKLLRHALERSADAEQLKREISALPDAANRSRPADS